jgi:hypothetical protein
MSVYENKFEFFPQGTGIEEFDEALAVAGYSYDPISDIFYSVMDPWQRKFGYCRLYDEAAAPLGMIVDCEPIHFEYNGTKWLVELWKGQYDYVTGGEIGVYTGALDINIPGIFSGTFYNSVSDSDRLPMSYTLKKNGKKLFIREEVHWWLTGFKLGEFSRPSELTMDIDISFHNTAMRDAFADGARKIGYPDKKLSKHGNSIGFSFGAPYTQQPLTRTHATDWIIQKKNEIICDKYQEITKSFNNTQDKIGIIKEQAPEMYNAITNIGKTNKIFGAYDTIKNYLNV